MKTNKKQFELINSPAAYTISIHMRNLIATYGEENVRYIIKDLFLTQVDKKDKKTKKAL